MFAVTSYQHHGQAFLPMLAAAARAAWSTHSAFTSSSAAWQRGYATAAAPANKMVLIRELREKSGAPINDVKACLEAMDWQLDQAYDALRKKGLAAAARKASRHAAEGLVAVAQDGPGRAAIVEVNSETDFVARNERFKALVSAAAQAALGLTQDAVGSSHEVDVEQMGALQLQPRGGVSVSEACAEVAAVVRENIKLRRGFLLTSPGVISSYMHMPVAPGLGRIAALVALEGPAGVSTEQLSELGRSLAMHVAGLRPQYLDGASIPQHIVAAERALLHEQAASSGKGAQVVERMVEGRLAKYRQEVCLLDQKYLLDDSLTVRQLLAQAGSKGAPMHLSAFMRVQCGEGLEAQQEGDFAAEVAQMAASQQ